MTPHWDILQFEAPVHICNRTCKLSCAQQNDVGTHERQLDLLVENGTANGLGEVVCVCCSCFLKGKKSEGNEKYKDFKSENFGGLMRVVHDCLLCSLE